MMNSLEREIEARKVKARAAVEMYNAHPAEAAEALQEALGPFLPAVGWRVPGEEKHGLAPSYGLFPDAPKECHMNFVDWLRGPAPEVYEKARSSMLAWLAEDHQRREEEYRAEKVRTRRPVETVAAPRPKRLRDFPPVVEPNTQSVAHLPEPAVAPLRWDAFRQRFVGGTIFERAAAAHRLRLESD